MALVNAVKELKAENEQLKTTSDKYEIRLTEMERKLEALTKNK